MSGGKSGHQHGDSASYGQMIELPARSAPSTTACVLERSKTAGPCWPPEIQDPLPPAMDAIPRRIRLNGP